jgi:hypothetical protein
MALYTELYQLALSDSTLRSRATVACVIAANTVRTEDPGVANHANRLLWAADALKHPAAWGERMLWAALAQNAGSTVAQIQGASDATLQTAINNTIDLFATGS